MSAWKPGQPITAKNLNRHSAELAPRDQGGAPGSVSTMGSATALEVRDMSQTGLWIRVFGGQQVESTEGSAGPTQTVWQYSWEGLWWDNNAKRWQRNQSLYGHIDGDPATAADLGQLTETSDSAMDPTVEAPEVNAYLAARDPVSRRLVVMEGGGGGEVEFFGKDMVLMILGPWTDYDDCLNAPDDPPVATNVNCPPAYAWSAYKVCGYRMRKVATFLTGPVDAETPGQPPIPGMGFWATGLNGIGTTSWRRFHPAFWGWDTLNTSPFSPSNGCAGVRFISPGIGPLVCTCPAWLQAVQCIKIRVKYIEDPGEPFPGCEACYEKMDGFWGEEHSAILCNEGMGCLWQSNSGPLPFGSATAVYQDITAQDPCYTGPDEIDECNLCDGWGALAISIQDASNPSGCGGPSNTYTGGYVKESILKPFIAACNAGLNPAPIRLSGLDNPGICPNYVEWIQIECCSESDWNSACGGTSLAGGGPGDSFGTSVSGGGPGDSFATSISGGTP